MPIDTELILRQALEFARLELDPARAAELSSELRGLVEGWAAIIESATFDDDPAHFLAVLSDLADPPLG